MKLAKHPLLDMLIGEYILGTLRGRARRRFERAMIDEPWINTRVATLTQQFSPSIHHITPEQPSAAVWKSITKALHIEKHPVHVWSSWAVDWLRLDSKIFGLVAAMSLALTIGAVMYFVVEPQTPSPGLVAQIKQSEVRLALRTNTGHMILKGTFGVLAKADQRYELWLVTAERKAPQSMGFLNQLSLTGEEANKLKVMLSNGAKLAVSIEPVGGSPTGLPTGPVTVLEITTQG